MVRVRARNGDGGKALLGLALAITARPTVTVHVRSSRLASCSWRPTAFGQVSGPSRRPLPQGSSPGSRHTPILHQGSCPAVSIRPVRAQCRRTAENVKPYTASISLCALSGRHHGRKTEVGVRREKARPRPSGRRQSHKAQASSHGTTPRRTGMTPAIPGSCLSSFPSKDIGYLSPLGLSRLKMPGRAEILRRMYKKGGGLSSPSETASQHRRRQDPGTCLFSGPTGQRSGLR